MEMVGTVGTSTRITRNHPAAPMVYLLAGQRFLTRKLKTRHRNPPQVFHVFERNHPAATFSPSGWKSNIQRPIFLAHQCPDEAESQNREPVTETPKSTGTCTPNDLFCTPRYAKNFKLYAPPTTP